MNFEPAATKTVPILPEVEGDPAPGYELGIRTAEPATVEVVGPQSAVARTTTAITEPVSVAGAAAAVVQTVSVGVAEPTVRIKNVDVVRVTVNIRRAAAKGR
jgi:YbbR domain-containing protein